jgi:hypothetical protein
MRIRIQQLKLMRIHADPDTDPDPKPCFEDNKLLRSPKKVFIVFFACDERIRIQIRIRTNNYEYRSGKLLLSLLKPCFYSPVFFVSFFY